jgi:hypothetical protein
MSLARGLIRRFRLALAIVSLVIAAAGQARAVPIGMPAGSRVWMELDSNACDEDGDSDCTGSSLLGSNPPNGIPLSTFSESNGATATAYAEAFPDQVRTLVGGYSGAGLYVSLLDTYTAHGPAVGSFSITVHLEAEGTASGFYLARTNNYGLSGAVVTVEIGTFDSSTSPAFHEPGRVTPFSSSSSAG